MKDINFFFLTEDLRMDRSPGNAGDPEHINK